MNLNFLKSYFRSTDTNIEQLGPSASAVILANEYSNSIFYEGVADAIADKDVDLRLFGKPDSRPCEEWE